MTLYGVNKRLNSLHIYHAGGFQFWLRQELCVNGKNHSVG